MLKNERQKEILEILKKDSFATVASLAERLYASLPTVRRDLTLLEDDGYVKRCHGGAMILDENTKPPIYFRRGQNTREKLRMCEAAAALIAENDTVFIDSSTSAYHMTDFLKKKSGLTVVTNSLPLATDLVNTDVRIYTTGGRLLKQSLAFVGASAEKSVESYNANTLIFSVASLSVDGILSDWSEDEAMLRIAMAKNARKRVLLCDSSKFNTSSTFKLFSLDNIEFVVTDEPLPEKITKEFGYKLMSALPAYLYFKE